VVEHLIARQTLEGQNGLKLLLFGVNASRHTDS
jgi:hypothetical protein